MPLYAELIQTGMRQVREFADSLTSNGTECEWGPMDNAGRFPLRVRSKGPATVLLRLTKAELARCAGDPEQWNDVQSAVAASLQSFRPTK